MECQRLSLRNDTDTPFFRKLAFKLIYDYSPDLFKFDQYLEKN